MYKKAKRKIVISILAILVAVLVGTLGMIYLASYHSGTSQNYEILEKHAEMIENGEPPQNDPGQLDEGQNAPEQPNEEQSAPAQSNVVQAEANQTDSDTNDAEQNDAGQASGDFLAHDPGHIRRGMEVGTFYSVKRSDDGTWSVLENGADGVYSDEQLLELAESVADSDKGKGRTSDLLYVVKFNDGEAIVTFMDNAVFTESFTRLFLFTMLFGLIAIVVIAFISIHIANRIVMPMEENDRKQKQFTADAGHELKTPITAVTANLELLEREIGPNKWLDNISYENERMRELVTELLDLARSENQPAQRTETDLSRLVNGAILPLEAAAFEKNILIESEICDGLTANIDGKKMGQLVTILIDNAISHTTAPAGALGKVTVTLSAKKGVPILAVSNPGDEIPAEEREKLFERFYRSDSSHEFTGHYGLGLAIAKAIADANDAKISIQCESGMVTFLVVFPEK